MSSLSANQDKVSRMNSLAEELLRKLVESNEDENNVPEAELLLAEFMRLMGYQVQ